MSTFTKMKKQHEKAFLVRLQYSCLIYIYIVRKISISTRGLEKIDYIFCFFAIDRSGDGFLSLSGKTGEFLSSSPTSVLTLPGIMV